MLSLLDQIKNNKNIKVLDEIKKIVDIFEYLSTYIYRAFEEGYLSSPFCVLEPTLEGAINKITTTYDSEMDTFRYFSELLLTSINYIDERHRDLTRIKQIKSIIESDLSLLGLEIIFDHENGVYKTKLSKPNIQVIVSNYNKSISDKIDRYLSLKSDEIEEKRKEIKSLCDDVEKYCSSSSNNNVKKLRQFYQCVRHTKESPKSEFPFYYEDESIYLDMIFEMIVDVLGMMDLETKAKQIVSLENFIAKK